MKYINITFVLLLDFKDFICTKSIRYLHDVITAIFRVRNTCTKQIYTNYDVLFAYITAVFTGSENIIIEKFTR